jgi:hypothetical protein
MDDDVTIQGARSALQVCLAAVLDVFPDICSDFVTKEAAEHDNNALHIISAVAERLEFGIQYPQRPKGIKRKRPHQDQDSGDESGLTDALKTRYEDGREECRQDAYYKLG